MWFLHLCIQAEFSRKENLHSYSSCTHCSCLKPRHLPEHHGGFHFVVAEIYFLLQLAVSTDGVLLAYLLFLCSQHVYSINVERSLLSPSAIMEEKHFLFCVVVVCLWLFGLFFKNASSYSSLHNSVLSFFRAESQSFWKGAAWEKTRIRKGLPFVLQTASPPRLFSSPTSAPHASGCIIWSLEQQIIF